MSNVINCGIFHFTSARQFPVIYGFPLKIWYFYNHFVFFKENYLEKYTLKRQDNPLSIFSTIISLKNDFTLITSNFKIAMHYVLWPKNACEYNLLTLQQHIIGICSYKLFIDNRICPRYPQGIQQIQNQDIPDSHWKQ